MKAPDGMASMAQERKHMREMRRLDQQDPFTHDVVAVDSDGNKVFETESLRPNQVEGSLDDYPEGDDAPEGVDHYEVRER